ncbi:MAG TPA: metal ABC transporter substrate-binding protein [Gaiellaceae bacterium]|nr:metal ABC transporter substrate-binding protein [Gaiellaceae bacterium]
MLTRIALTLICFFGLTACGGAEADGRKRVVAAFYPLAFAAERIGTARVDVRNLTPPGVEPHDIELSGRDVEAIGDADLVLYLGERFQPALEEAIETTSANGVDLLDGLPLRAAGGSGEDEPGGLDPHVWLDPIRYSGIAEKIGSELGRPAQHLVAELSELDAEFRAGLRDCERREVVTSHAAFGYLTQRYGLEQVAISGLSPEVEPTPRELERVVRAVEARGATTIFFETLISPRLARTVAREVGAETAVLNPLEGLSARELDAGEDYFSVMRANLAALRRALACR